MLVKVERLKKIVVNGTFDLLHGGHIDLLNMAKMYGDYLIVAIDTDRRVRIHKGKDRPINNQNTRRKILENIKAVDEVVLFNSNDELISIISDCDLRIIGSDWKKKQSAIVGRKACKLLFFDRVNDESTTKTIEDYINRRQL
tara:strand:- start:1600 stop:2025 length:426 start_codon:yes stop_codon:yes gene_type:complete